MNIIITDQGVCLNPTHIVKVYRNEHGLTVISMDNGDEYDCTNSITDIIDQIRGKKIYKLVGKYDEI